MKNLSTAIGRFAFATILFFSADVSAQSEKDFTQYVDPLIGTAHCRWFHIAPGAYPFGMAKPGPATNSHIGNKSGWEATGYDYREMSIEGFPNFHEFQVGGVVLMPTNGELKTIPGSLENPDEGYRSRFDRSDEYATAGYYSVLLKDYNIKAEMTATPRVAFHRYTFPQGNDSRILFDIGNRQGESGAVSDASISLNEDATIEGYVITHPEYVKKYQNGANVKLFFYAEIDKQPIGFGAFKGKTTYKDQRSIEGVGSGLYLNFATKENESVSVKMGLSYTSIENAKNNLKTEASNMDFDMARANSKQVWNEYLGRIDVETSNNADKVKFYTGLYQALKGRGLASDVSGNYPAHDGSVGQIPLENGKPIHNHYNTDAVWGAFWNLTQLWSLAYPEYLSDFVSSQLLVYKDAGWLGDGIACSKYVSGVGTNFIGLLMSGAYACGIRDFDVNLAYEAARKNELDGVNRPLGAGKIDTDRFIKQGYVDHQENGDGPDEAFMFSASHTLEYSFSAWAVGQWAEMLGKKKDAKQLSWLSKGWERIFDSSSFFMRPKDANGNFIADFNPMQVWRGFQEGNAWQYTFYVPHTPDQLINKVGEKRFVSRLDSIFTVSESLIFSGGQTIDAFAGLETLYNHGNQPCLHIPWLFNYTSSPRLTQKWVRSILNSFYGTDGVHGYGYGQDEDQGQLGAWYVISSIGLFDVKGLTGKDPMLSVGSPLFDKVTIRLNPKYYSGETFEIVAKGNSSDTPYIQQMLLNGDKLKKPFVLFKDIVKGGKLELEMGSMN